MMAKIYVSSTFLDLQDYRAQVERVIRRMGHEDVAMICHILLNGNTFTMESYRLKREQ